MKLPPLQSIYDTEQVRQLLEWAEGAPKTPMDVHNRIRRPGMILEHTYIRPGAYDRQAVDEAMIAILCRRLAHEMGRKSPRFLSLDERGICPECQGISVHWDGKWKCENGHQGELNSGEKSDLADVSLRHDPESPGTA